MTRWVITNDEGFYFVRLNKLEKPNIWTSSPGLARVLLKDLPPHGLWEAGELTEARRFATRAAASKVLTTHGQHRQGWRVVPIT